MKIVFGVFLRNCTFLAKPTHWRNCEWAGCLCNMRYMQREYFSKSPPLVMFNSSPSMSAPSVDRFLQIAKLLNRDQRDKLIIAVTSLKVRRAAMIAS